MLSHSRWKLNCQSLLVTRQSRGTQTLQLHPPNNPASDNSVKKHKSLDPSYKEDPHGAHGSRLNDIWAGADVHQTAVVTRTHTWMMVTTAAS